MNIAPNLTDAHQPREIAGKVQSLGVAKARMDGLTVLVLSILAGAFIAIASMFYIVVVTDSTLGFGLTRLLGGIVFCLGLVLVVIAGAELFTGNNLLAMAWASRLIRTNEVLRNWALVYAGNVLGSIGIVLLVVWGNIDNMDAGAVGETALKIAAGKTALSIGEAFARGILCNALVCLAIWLAMGGRGVTDKILAVLFPVAGFVAMGFEHSIANWFFLPYAMCIDEQGSIELAGVAQNLVAVSAGNIVGGTLLVAGFYWMAYLRKSTESTGESTGTGNA